MSERSKKYLRNESVVRFLLVGGLATGIDFCIYIVVRIYIGNIYGKFVSMLCAMIFSFFVNKTWTFKSDNKTDARTVALFALSQAINIATNVGVNTLMLQLTNFVFVSFIIATGVAMVVNYLCQNFFVFKV